MIPTMQTFFGVTLALSTVSIAPTTARAIATRLRDAVKLLDQEDAPVALAAELRHDAQRYLAVRRTRELRLPTSLGRVCDDHARAVLQLTANTPPRRNVPERLVA